MRSTCASGWGVGWLTGEAGSNSETAEAGHCVGKMRTRVCSPGIGTEDNDEVNLPYGDELV